MAEEAAAAAPVHEGEEQPVVAADTAADAETETPLDVSGAGSGGQKRARDGDEVLEPAEPESKRLNANGEVTGVPEPDAGTVPSAGDDLPAATPADAPAATADAPAAGGAPSGTADAGQGAPAGGNPGHGSNPGNPGGAAFIDEEADRELTTHPDGAVSEVLHIARTMVGKLIGKGGATIMGLQSSTGCSIQVDQHTATRGGECRRVTLKGAPSAVEAAKKAVRDALEAEPGVPAAGGETSSDLSCPQHVVGRIIGRAGETIKLLQGASGAYILVNQNFPDGVDRVITISGSTDAVQRASSMVRDLISSDLITVQSVIQKYGLGKTIKMQCPRHAVGRIIGRSGETVKMLQRKYNCSVQIDQSSVDPMDVTVIGMPRDAEACQAEIMAIMYDGPPMGMGPPPFGGPPMGPMGMRPPFGMPFGGFGGMPYGAMMGGYPPMMGGYGGGYDYAYGAAPGAYGAAPGAYGAAGGYGADAADAGAYGAAGAQTSPGAYGGAGAYGGGAPQTAPAAASVWQAIPDDQGRTYYYNTQTGVSQWEKPPGMA